MKYQRTLFSHDQIKPYNHVGDRSKAKWPILQTTVVTLMHFTTWHITAKDRLLETEVNAQTATSIGPNSDPHSATDGSESCRPVNVAVM